MSTDKHGFKRMKTDKHGENNKLLEAELSYKIRGCFYRVFNQYGPGLKEIVYHKALAEELQNQGLNFVSNPRINNRLILTNDRKPFLRVNPSSIRENPCKIRVNPCFTLMELLIIVAMLTLVATVVLVFLNPKKQLEKVWDGKRKHELSQLKKVLEDWYNDKQCYPKPSEICYDASDIKTTCHICGRSPQSPSFSPYLSSLPCDPQSPTKEYLYQVDDVDCPRLYRIYTTLSNSSDPAIAEVGCSQNCGPGDVTGYIYNYAVTSPNTAPESGPGGYYCSGIGNCTSYDNTKQICTPSFSGPNCGGDASHHCENQAIIGTCVFK